MFDLHPRVAVLEDDPTTRVLLSELFTALGYVVDRDVNHADVVIADVPPGDRSQRLSYLVSTHSDRVLVVTTRGSRYDALRLVRRYGISLEQIVFKPYDAPWVAHRVAAELDRRRIVAMYG